MKRLLWLYVILATVAYTKVTISLLPFSQTSTPAGWPRIWTPTYWWKPGGRWDTTCPPTAPCTGTPWTLRESNFPDWYSSSQTTTTRSGACRCCMKSRWRVWGISTERRPRCGVVGVWSAPSTRWFTRPSGRGLTGTINVKPAYKQVWFGIEGLKCCFFAVDAGEMWTGISDCCLTNIVFHWNKRKRENRDLCYLHAKCLKIDYLSIWPLSIIKQWLNSKVGFCRFAVFYEELHCICLIFVF